MLNDGICNCNGVHGCVGRYGCVNMLYLQMCWGLRVYVWYMGGMVVLCVGMMSWYGGCVYDVDVSGVFSDMGSLHFEFVVVLNYCITKVVVLGYCLIESLNC